MKVADYIKANGKGLYERVTFQDLANLEGQKLPADITGATTSAGARDLGEAPGARARGDEAPAPRRRRSGGGGRKSGGRKRSR